MVEDDDIGVRVARGSSGDLPEEGLARDLSDLARQLQAESSMESLFDSIVAAALLEVDGAEYAGISVIQGRRVHTEAASDELVEKVDELQYRAGDGPCLTSLREHITVRSTDLETETRWPGFAREASGEGVRSMLSFQLFVESDNLGALNLYATVPDAFTDDDESVGLLLAAHAAIAMKASRNNINLRAALVNRDVIGQAKGILMERLKIDQVEAFRLLSQASKRSNRKLIVIAEELTLTGDLRTTNW
jgi:GAF domain-containing protein